MSEEHEDMTDDELIEALDELDGLNEWESEFVAGLAERMHTARRLTGQRESAPAWLTRGLRGQRRKAEQIYEERA